jgi:hypothetical protein
MGPKEGEKATAWLLNFLSEGREGAIREETCSCQVSSSGNKIRNTISFWKFKK